MMPAPTTTVDVTTSSQNLKNAGRLARPEALPVEDRLHCGFELRLLIGGERAERCAAVVDRQSLQFAAILDLLHELAAFKDVHRPVEHDHLLPRLLEIARAESMIEVD